MRLCVRAADQYERLLDFKQFHRKVISKWFQHIWSCRSVPVNSATCVCVCVSVCNNAKVGVRNLVKFGGGTFH